MKLYAVHNKEKDQYLHRVHEHFARWCPLEQADLFHTYEIAYEAAMGAYYWDDNDKNKFEIILLEARVIGIS